MKYNPFENKRTNLLMVSIAIALLAISMTLVAYQDSDDSDATSTDDLTYIVNDGELIISGTGPMKDFSSDHTLSELGEFTSCEIEEGVTSIGDYAFYGCASLGYIAVPESITSIGDYSFSDCTGFASCLIIPDNVVTIGDSAFSDCTGFTGSLTIGNGVEMICERAFSGCSGFTGSLTIGDNVRSIGAGAFSLTNFTGPLVIPDGVVTIGGYAFMNCSNFKGSLIIPDSVVTIGDKAFSGTAFTGSLVIGDGVVSIGKVAFSGCHDFNGTLTIGSSVESIGEDAFLDCYGFTGSLVLPENVTIGNTALFAYGLTNLVIPSNVEFETDSPFVGTFYAEDGTTQLEQTAENLCGYTFKSYHVGQYGKHDDDTGMIRVGTIQECTVTYNLNSGSGSAPVQSQVMEMSRFTVASYSGERYGYTFGGWTSQNGTVYETGDTCTVSDTDVVLTAIWIGTADPDPYETVDVNDDSVCFPDTGLGESNNYSFRLNNRVIATFQGSDVSGTVKFTASQCSGDLFAEGATVYSLNLNGADSVNVCIPSGSYSNPAIHHVDDYGDDTVIDSSTVTIDGIEYLSFDADQFSYYYIAETGSESSGGSSDIVMIVAAIAVVIVAIATVIVIAHKRRLT